MSEETVRFEVGDGGDAAAGEDLRTPVTPQGATGPAAGRSRPPAREAEDRAATRPPLGVLRRVSYAVGLLLALALLLLWMNPHAGHVREWPWDLFLARGEDGSTAFRFAWAPNHALALELALAGAGLLLAALLPAGRGRGLLGLTVTTLAFATFYFREEGVVLDSYAVVAAVGPLLAGVLWLASDRRSGGARILLAAGLLVVGLGLFVPYPLRAAGEGEARIEPPPPVAAAVEFFEDLSGGDPEQTPLDALTDPPGAWMVALLGLAAVGLLSLVGLGGRWAAPAAFALAVLLALGTHVSTLWHTTHPDPGSRMAPDLHAGLRDVASALRYGFYPFFLPLGAAIADLALGRRGRG